MGSQSRVRRGRRGVRLVEPARDGRTWWCRPFGGAHDLPVPADTVPGDAEPGSTWIAEVSTFEDGTMAVLRIVAPLAEHADELLDPDAVPPVGRAPAPRRTASRRSERLERLERGTIVSAHIDFSGTPGHRDGNLLGKFRPCVVIADHGPTLDVQPLFTSGGAAGRGGHRVVDWHAAGLTKPTVLGPQTVRITMDDLGTRIGRLTDRDLPHLNPARR